MSGFCAKYDCNQQKIHSSHAVIVHNCDNVCQHRKRINFHQTKKYICSPAQLQRSLHSFSINAPKRMPCDVTSDERDRNPELMGIRGKEISTLNPLPRSCSRSVCG